MPEYLAPGVFVEEVSFRAKSIEGVPTSTTGMAGRTRFGPVQYQDGPADSEPRLITSFVEFERLYGQLDQLDGDVTPVLAHAARAFFLNGGQRLYVSRVHAAGLADTAGGVASGTVPQTLPAGTTATATWHARWPGRMGNVLVEVRPMRSRNVAVKAELGDQGPLRANRARNGALVEVVPAASPMPKPDAPLSADKLRVVSVDNAGRQSFSGGTGAIQADDRLLLVELEVLVRVDPERVDRTVQMGCHPNHRRYIGDVLHRDHPEDDTGVVWLDPMGADAIVLAVALTGAGADPAVGRFELGGGNDGVMPTADQLLGKEADPDHAEIKATGLTALGEIEDIAIVAMPDAAVLGGDATVQATSYLIQHAERQGAYRIAIVDAPKGSSLNEVRAFRGNFDSTRAALYHPWVEILDPNQSPEQGMPPDRMVLPPSGFVAGIYARSDVTRGVHKAPANEVVQGLTRFEANINTARQQVLNPEGVNCLRFFSGRGNRVWGARTLTSDPEWKYVNVRRFFLYLEHSVDKATQWAVFEPNGEALWQKIVRSVEDFLDVQWRNGALLGSTSKQAYFVRCDRTTMTQNDLDNGRLICLIGVAPVRPAEFVIFRIGQWTADARS
ncbi:phage tail sheath subtilisin-like domain-containing protein [Lentzea sp. BCCO 10_0856]|uniref:Phage tail sheath subtilisin-like domain-containing protein n=1 Tax=Lentzea miocenica TaxID=3095431 RepID=A0ABU4SZQ3_9PSEU|nr:phage tail sheath subtilisin-like domain-containing protein [Lentzea sp. BCCO 10_0856]MDX8031384.1 phage tail sheath subtilisin-like domain-containing protein [Lentzea sp. BCCO 10_0856]